MLRRATLLLLIGALIQATQAGTPLPITKLQSRRLPEPIVTQRILDQLSTVLSLQHYDMTGRPPPRLPLSEVWYWLKPYAIDYEGLCEIDSVVFQFHRIGPLRAAATATRARSIEIHRGYYLKAPPPQFAPSDLNEVSVPQADLDCGKIDPNKTATISADSTEIAWKASWLLSEVVRQSRENKQAFAIDCTAMQTNCALSVSNLGASHISSIVSCTKPESGKECIAMYLNGPNWETTYLGIVYELHGETRAIVSISPAEAVTNADQRAD